ncbi:hypothetical protein BGY98DRAFT_940670 [Russula aff. rugulosa BPL654]|nr:hypothetical protein BGY98DRAFT_940670 [Russula aff. rugulosa BPL654]
MNPSAHLAMGQHIWSSYFYAIGNKIPQHFWAIMNPSVTSGDGPTQCHRQYLVRRHRQSPFGGLLGPLEAIGSAILQQFWALTSPSVASGMAQPYAIAVSHLEQLGHFYAISSKIPQQFWAIMNPSVTSGDGPAQCHRQYLVQSVLANSIASAVPLWMAVGPTRSHPQHNPTAILGHHEPISRIWRWSNPMLSASPFGWQLGPLEAIGGTIAEPFWAIMSPSVAPGDRPTQSCWQYLVQSSPFGWLLGPLEAIGSTIQEQFWAIMSPSVASGDGPTQCYRQYLVQSVLANSMPSAVPLWMAVGPTRSHRQHNSGPS